MPLHKLGQFFVVAVALSAVFSFLSTLNNGLAANLSSQVEVIFTNTLPTASSITINGGSPIILSGNTTTPVYINMSLIDTDGCSDIDTSKTYVLLYRSGYSSTTCLNNPSYRACYYAPITATSSCISQTQINATATVPLWYFADATDASSSFSAQDWKASVVVYDLSGTDESLPTSLSRMPAFVHNGRAYVLGGRDNGEGFDTSTVRYATINSFGTIAGWATTTPLPSAITYHPAFVHNNRAYVLGGDMGGGSPTTTVRYATINSSGTIDSWATTTPLLSAITYHPAFVYNNRAYVLGGYNGSSPIANVRYATINSSGTIGSWNNTTALPTAIYHFSSFAYNNYAYILGGMGGGTTATTTVRYATINASGTIGSWATTTPLSGPISQAASFVHNNRIYILGGVDNGYISTTTVRYATINSSGTIGAWTNTNPLPSAIYEHSAFAYNNRAYIFGGGTSTVLSASIKSDGSLDYWGQGNVMVDGGSGVELNTLLSINPATSTIDYGTVNPNTNTGSTNQELQIFNTGNATYTLNISGTALSSGGNSISTSSQHFASGTFTYGGSEEQLASTPVSLSGVSVFPGGDLRGGWTDITPLPSPVQYAGIFDDSPDFTIANGYIYVSIPTTTPTIYFGKINSNGTISSWATTTAASSTDPAYFSYSNGYFYSLFNNYDFLDILYAPAGASGTIGAWSSLRAGPEMSNIANGVSFIFNNNYVYAVGGIDTSTVRYARVNATGSIGTWNMTSPLAFGIGYSPVVIVDDHLYSLGGANCCIYAPYNTTQYARINASGTLSAWATTTPISVAGINEWGEWGQSAVFTQGNFIYLLGGGQNGDQTSTVMVSVLPGGGLGEWNNGMQQGLKTGWGGRVGNIAYNGYAYMLTNNSTTVSFTPISSKSSFWGLSVPGGTSIGTYSGVNTITAVYSP